MKASVGDPDVRLDVVLEFDRWGRKHFRELFGHIRMVDRPLEIREHFRRELTRAVDRPRARVLPSCSPTRS
jgi:hypothetical protein